MSDDGEPGGPLRGIRVIDVGTRISAPFCAGLLGELGADVIKVELPGEGDFMRNMGPFVPVEDGPDYSLSWAVEGRGRRGVTCDLRDPEGKELFKRLVATADVLCENFRPGTMERWGLGPEDLSPDLVYVRISAFGQTGPNAPRPGLDRLGIAFGGLLNLTGEPDRPPVRSGVNISDYLTGTFAAVAAVAALYGRDASVPAASQRADRHGDVIDAALYGSVLRVLEWTLAGYDRLGIVRQREGNRLSTSAPLDNYPTADGTYVCIVAGSDANFRRLCAAMGRPELTQDPRFDTLAHRADHGDEINGMVEAWTTAHSAGEITARCVDHDVPVGTAYSAADIFADPHMAERGDLVPIEDPVIGAVRQQAPFPRLAKNPGGLPVGAPRLGEHNKEVWCGLVGMSEAELGDLSARGVV
ncbi:MAG TPA: CaiB/BaiF CoA-transferase family protein [Acidimicrobiales bacterium]|jgi:crotonobetainyl-CoA:carnitine CoA-transferase CaiB-like acyl-CoA transferase|nr:CaiB/BaiF CoA-transferase family protein [Acidimicrobiales bacterium]